MICQRAKMIVGHKGWFCPARRTSSLCGAVCRPTQASELSVRPALLWLPNAYLVRLRHQEESKYEAHRWNRDTVEQRVGETPGGRIGRRGDKRYQSATPTVTDVVGHRDRGVADPAGEEFRQERSNRPIDHSDVGHENSYDADRRPEVALTRLRERSQPAVQGIVGDRG